MCELWHQYIKLIYSNNYIYSKQMNVDFLMTLVASCLSLQVSFFIKRECY